jgi:hypothetical protein
MKGDTMIRKKNQSGQIALIGVLVLMIATTVGLSLIARSTTDVSVSRNIEESNRAFSAAEAGIEESLKSGSGSGGDVTVDPSLGVKYNVAVSDVGGGVGAFEFPQPTVKEDTETVWLVDHDAAGNIIETPTYKTNTIDVCWSSGSPNPAIVVSVLYHKNGGTYQIAKVVFDPDSRIPNLTASAAPGCTANTAYKGTINFPGLGITPISDTVIALRIRPVYTGARIAVLPTQNLPHQGSTVQSTGTSGSNVSRKIVAYKEYRAPASIFDYTVYSEQGSFSQ